MTPRLYIDGPLHSGLPAPLTAEQAHYLKNVLRRTEGDDVRLFNGRDGEFAARILELKKKRGAVQVMEQTRQQEGEPDITLDDSNRAIDLDYSGHSYSLGVRYYIY